MFLLITTLFMRFPATYLAPFVFSEEAFFLFEIVVGCDVEETTDSFSSSSFPSSFFVSFVSFFVPFFALFPQNPIKMPITTPTPNIAVTNRMAITLRSAETSSKRLST